MALADVVEALSKFEGDTDWRQPKAPTSCRLAIDAHICSVTSSSPRTSTDPLATITTILQFS